MIYLNNKNSNIRRIDELGRIVIPKDVRKKLHIKDNEPLEIFIENENIVVKKYSALPDIIDFIQELIDIGYRITGNKYIITNRSIVLSSIDVKYKDQNISQQLESYCLTGSEIKNKNMELSITKSETINAHIYLTPILIEGDRSGIIIEYNENNQIIDEKVIKIFKTLIEKRFNSC